MGTYTELVLKCNVRSDINQLQKDWLNHTFNVAKCSNVTVGATQSFYHVPWVVSKYDDNCIFARIDIKNYHSQLQSLIEKIIPLLDIQYRVCIGWLWHENWELPELIVTDGKEISYLEIGQNFYE